MSTTQPAHAPAPLPDPELAALRAISEGTAHATGEGFFRSLVQQLAVAMNVNHAFVAEFCAEQRVRTLAYWQRSRLVENVEYDLRGTPCEDVVQGSLCHYPAGVKDKFPEDRALVAMGIEGYLGVPLLDGRGQHLGHLAVFHEQAMPPEPKQLFIFRIFAARAAAELERLRIEHDLRESERRYRDLYEEAPIAYIYEDLESRFVRANRAACRLLGIKPEEITSTYGVKLLAPTPETQQRVREALDAMKNHGKEFACVELELRRKDNGQPIWVQWWSKPEPDGQHTRTMIVDITDRVLMEREKKRLEQQNVYLQEEIKSVHNFEEIVGQSAPLLAALESVRKVAQTDSTVLIQGETGTGKELITRAIHSVSPRRTKPLIKVNCAALPAGLVESELFGHERGAFSGAIARRVGRFELADGGTIFLDEVGEIPMDVQVKLLRVLQEREFERVGGHQSIRVDVRVVAATNRDLAGAVRDGKFREDLFYRLNVFPITMPPLRERVGDIALLTQFLVKRLSSRIGKKLRGVSPATMKALAEYRWPGNVRELENVLERAIILETDDVLEIPADVLGDAQRAGPAATPARSGDSLQSVEKQHILNVLSETGWVIDGPRGAAQVLGLHPNTLRSRMKRLQITRAAHDIS